METTQTSNGKQTRKMGGDGREQDIPDQPVLTHKLVKAQKAYTWEAKVDCARSNEEAFRLICEADDMFRARYGDDGTKTPPPVQVGTDAPADAPAPEGGEAQ